MVMIIQRMKSTNKTDMLTPNNNSRIENSIHNSYQIRKSILFQMYNFSSVSFKNAFKMNIPPKFISPTHNLKCYVLSATTSTWNDCFVELIDCGGKIWNLQKNLRWTLCLVILIVQKNEKYNDDDDDEWYCVLYHLQFADVSCLWSIHFLYLLNLWFSAIMAK